MQAILTKILPATNFRPTRIKATCARGSVTISAPMDFATYSEEAHRCVAQILIGQFLTDDEEQYRTPRIKNPWNRPFVTGCLPNGDYCHVFTS